MPITETVGSPRLTTQAGNKARVTDCPGKMWVICWKKRMLGGQSQHLRHRLSRLLICFPLVSIDHYYAYNNIHNPSYPQIIQQKIFALPVPVQYTFSKWIISHLIATGEVVYTVSFSWSIGNLFCTYLYSYYFQNISSPLSYMNILMSKVHCWNQTCR